MKTLSTGKIDFELPFDNGDICVISFNPNDIDFYDKLLKLESNIQKVFEGYENISVNSDNLCDIIEKIKNDTSLKIKGEFDVLFGDGASEKIFKYCSPISIAENQYYPYYFLNAFLPDVAKAIDKTNIKARENAEKMLSHTAKYIKK